MIRRSVVSRVSCLVSRACLPTVSHPTRGLNCSHSAASRPRAARSADRVIRLSGEDGAKVRGQQGGRLDQGHAGSDARLAGMAAAGDDPRPAARIPLEHEQRPAAQVRPLSPQPLDRPVRQSQTRKTFHDASPSSSNSISATAPAVLPRQRVTSSRSRRPRVHGPRLDGQLHVGPGRLTGDAGMVGTRCRPPRPPRPTAGAGENRAARAGRATTRPRPPPDSAALGPRPREHPRRLVGRTTTSRSNGTPHAARAGG